MPLYEFEDEETGEVVEIQMAAELVPSIGTTRNIDGRRLKRLMPSVQRPNMNEWHVRAYSQRPYAKGADWYDENGAPVIEGKKGMRKFLDAQRREVEKDGRGQTDGEILGFDGSTTV